MLLETAFDVYLNEPLRIGVNCINEGCYLEARIHTKTLNHEMEDRVTYQPQDTMSLLKQAGTYQQNLLKLSVELNLTIRMICLWCVHRYG